MKTPERVAIEIHDISEMQGRIGRWKALIAARDAEHAALWAERTRPAREFLQDQLDACSEEECELCDRARAALLVLDGGTT